jgi:abortive infection bacteriophage resistance protein
MQREYQHSKEDFAAHHKEKYPELILPPIWTLVELLSLGQLVDLYRNLNTRSLRQEIAHDFGLAETVFSSFALQLLQIRNICAHHARLWNRRFTIETKVPHSISEPHSLLFNREAGAQRHAYNAIVLLDLFETKMLGKRTIFNEVSNLIQKSSHLDLSQMGLPRGFEKLGVETQP